ncbi:MAG TPA: adenylyl-sulfate kinase [Methanomicrobia archaeon]|nr:adenylyl-sulfate kinase [Methanomicrobia archaeon]
MTWAVWLTGLPGSGKTAVAQRTRSLLEARGISRVQVLELDEIRKFITPKPTYSEDEREIVYAALVYMAKLLVDSGTPVIIDATANRRRYRDRARAVIPKFAEVYLTCPLELCKARERARKAEHAPPGIYQKAESEAATVPGVNVPYEAPLQPAVVVDCERMSVGESAEKVAAFIIGRFISK